MRDHSKHIQVTRDEAIARIQGRTREYMRKQLTWFRKDPAIRWFHPGAAEGIEAYLAESSILANH